MIAALLCFEKFKQQKFKAGDFKKIIDNLLAFSKTMESKFQLTEKHLQAQLHRLFEKIKQNKKIKDLQKYLTFTQYLANHLESRR